MWLREVDLVVTPCPVAPGLAAGVAGIGVLVDFGRFDVPRGRRHLKLGAECRGGFVLFALPRRYV